MRATALFLFAGLSACGTGAAVPERRPPPLPTPEGLIDASEPDPISGIAWRYGGSDWGRDGHGDPEIRAETAEGLPYRIRFYGCTAGRDCTDLRFIARFVGEDGGPLSADEIAAWNRTRRFGTAWLDDEDGAVLEMNVTLAGGVTRQNLEQVFDWWVVALAEFAGWIEPEGS